MKITKSLLAVSILAASQAHATPVAYTVSGSGTVLDGLNTMQATLDPALYVHAGSTAYSTTGVSWPTFSSTTWMIDIAAGTPTVTGRFGQFAQYSTSIRLSIGTAVVNQPNLIYKFQNGTVVYTADPSLVTGGTLTIGQAMTFSTSDSTALNAQTSDGTLQFDTSGSAGVCTGSSFICGGQTSQFLNKPDMERFYLTLTFSADFSTFTGTAVGADVGGPVPLGVTGNTWYHYTFSGELTPPPPVPVPGAAWLLGSGLVGLAGVARRRRQAQ